MQQMHAHMKAQHSLASAGYGGSAKRTAETPAAMVSLWSNPIQAEHRRHGALHPALNLQVRGLE